jgi:hypothetical protein
MKQEYILYIILAFFLGFLFKLLLNNKSFNNEKFFVDPSSWVRIGKENDTVNVPPNTNVRYGDPASNKWVEKVMSGSFQASNTIFGDPTPGVVKEIQSLTVDTPDSDDSSESDFDSEDSASPLDTDPPSLSTVPVDFSRYTKIMGKSKSGKTIKRYNNNQLKCVKDCALNKQCVGIITNQSGTRCKTITDFSNPRRSLNIAYLKK